MEGDLSTGVETETPTDLAIVGAPTPQEAVHQVAAQVVAQQRLIDERVRWDAAYASVEFAMHPDRLSECVHDCYDVPNGAWQKMLESLGFELSIAPQNADEAAELYERIVAVNLQGRTLSVGTWHAVALQNDASHLLTLLGGGQRRKLYCHCSRDKLCKWLPAVHSSSSESESSSED